MINSQATISFEALSQIGQGQSKTLAKNLESSHQCNVNKH